MATFEISENLLTVSGDLDSDAEPGLREALRQLFEGGAGLVTVDLSSVNAITSVCVGALVVLWIDLCSDKRQVKVVASPPVKKVLDMTGLSRLLMGGQG